MNHSSADQLNGHRIAGVHLKLRRGVCKLSRFDPKVPLLRRNGPHCQWREGHDQSSHYKEEKKETRTHKIMGYWMVRTWNKSYLYIAWLPADFSLPVTCA